MHCHADAQTCAFAIDTAPYISTALSVMPCAVRLESMHAMDASGDGSSQQQHITANNSSTMFSCCRVVTKVPSKQRACVAVGPDRPPAAAMHAVQVLPPSGPRCIGACIWTEVYKRWQHCSK